MPASHPLRVAIVNDYDVVVAGLARVLAAFPERVEVVELDSQLPVVADVDVVLFDSFSQVQGEQMDTGSVVKDPAVKVVVFSWNTQPEVVAGALRGGAAGYVSKTASAADLLDALERVAAGQQVTPPEEEAATGDVGRWPGDEFGLSAREAEVLALICQGLSNQEITERAFIGINTVKTHIRSLYRKIGVDTRPRAVIWGLAHGFAPDRTRITPDG